MAFQKGLGAVHALSHPLGGLKEPRLHHGTLNAVFLPAVLRFNGRRWARSTSEVGRRWAEGERAERIGVAAAVTALNERLGITQGAEQGRPEGRHDEQIADGALGDHC